MEVLDVLPVSSVTRQIDHTWSCSRSSWPTPSSAAAEKSVEGGGKHQDSGVVDREDIQLQNRADQSESLPPPPKKKKRCLSF